ncbi:MAG: hypothetical protein ABUS79_01585 [Pseudomonadota bacterium]
MTTRLSTALPLSSLGDHAPPKGRTTAADSNGASPTFLILRNGVTQSGLDLFSAYGIDFSAAADGVPPLDGTSDVVCPTYLAFAGFGGPHLSGFVVLGVPERVLRRSNVTLSSLDDWMAELANQFLGRIKNSLWRQGIPISRIPPAIVSGGTGSLFLGRTDAPPVTLTDHADSVWIWVKSEPSLESLEDLGAGQPRVERDVLAEGEMVLF